MASGVASMGFPAPPWKLFIFSKLSAVYFGVGIGRIDGNDIGFDGGAAFMLLEKIGTSSGIAPPFLDNPNRFHISFKTGRNKSKARTSGFGACGARTCGHGPCRVGTTLTFPHETTSGATFHDVLYV